MRTEKVARPRIATNPLASPNQLYVLNKAGLLTYDPAGGHKPLSAPNADQHIKTLRGEPLNS